MDKQRTSFEAWYVTDCAQHGFNVTMKEVAEMRGPHGDYRDRPALHGKWIGYQAGRAALQSQDRDYVSALHKALQALEAISDEMTVGDRFTNAGQYLLDALGPVREAIDHVRRNEGET